MALHSAHCTMSMKQLTQIAHNHFETANQEGRQTATLNLLIQMLIDRYPSHHWIIINRYITFGKKAGILCKG